MAVAHRLLVIPFHLLKGGETYREVGEDFHARKNAEKAAMRHVAGLQRLGYYVSLQKAEEPAPVAKVEAVSPQTVTQADRRRRGRPCKRAKKQISCTHRKHTAPDPEKQQATEYQTTENSRVGVDCFS
ncbi:MAG: hypothetical protein ABIO24_07055 [Saprospiraceae bacterium]